MHIKTTHNGESTASPLFGWGGLQPHALFSAHVRGVGATAARPFIDVWTSVSTPLEYLACLVPEGG